MHLGIQLLLCKTSWESFKPISIPIASPSLLKDLLGSLKISYNPFGHISLPKILYSLES